MHALLQFLPPEALDCFSGQEDNTVAVLCVGSLASVELFKADYQKRHKQAEMEFEKFDEEEEDEERCLDESNMIDEKYRVMFSTMSIIDRDSSRSGLILEIVEVEYETE